MGAMIQIITYHDFLLMLLGVVHYTGPLGPYQGYCYKKDPWLANIFTMVSCFRYTMMQPFVLQLAITIPTAPPHWHPEVMLLCHLVCGARGCIDSILQGLIARPAKMLKYLQNAVVVDEHQEWLFKRMCRFGQDLIAINLQQGWDHSISGYNVWRYYWPLLVQDHG